MKDIYTALTSPERRSEDEYVPYGWHIEVPGTDGFFVRHTDRKGYDYAKEKAVDVHGTIIPVFRERRKFG